MEYDFASAIFDITYKCNDECRFCFNKAHINKSPEMSLEEIKENYYYVKEKYNIKGVIISGGEPACHTEFWGMMDFFYNEVGEEIMPSLNTNSVAFADKKMANKLRDFLTAAKSMRKCLSLSLSTIEGRGTDIEKKKLKGIKNAILACLHSNTYVVVIVMVSKKNYSELPNILDYLIGIVNDYNKKTNNSKRIDIQLRMPYIGKEYLTEEQHIDGVPKNFSKVKPGIVNFIKKALNSNVIYLKLYNIPLCLINDEVPIHKLKKKYEVLPTEVRMKINFMKQKDKIKPGLFHGDAVLLKYCVNCLYKSECNKIQKEYITRSIIPNLVPFFGKEVSELRQVLLDNAIKFSTGKNQNGTIQDWLIDTREIILNPKGAHLVTKLLYEKIKFYDAEQLGGQTLAADPLVSYIVRESYEKNQPLSGFIIRKKPKKKDLMNLIEGDFKPGKDTVIVDDIINSGKTIFKAINSVKDHGCMIKGVVSLINYENDGLKNLNDNHYNTDFVYNLKDLYLRNKNDDDKEKKPDIIWSYNCNNWEGYPPRSNPVFYEGNILFGTNEGNFVCLDAKDGKIKWKYETDVKDAKGILSSAALHSNTVSFGAYNGYLYTLDAQTGECLWKKKRGDWIGSSPCAHKGTLYVGIEYGNYQGVIIACDAKSGKLKWYHKTRAVVHSSPNIDIENNIIVCGCNDNYIYSIDAESGKLLWEHFIGKETKAGFAIENGRVYFGSHTGKLYCFDTKTGKIIWERKVGEWVYTTPVIYQWLVIFAASSKRIFCLDKTSGSIKWMYMTRDRNFSYPLIFEDKLYIGSNDGFLYVFNPFNGNIIVKYNVGKAIVTKPLIRDGKVYIGCKGMLYCLWL